MWSKIARWSGTAAMLGGVLWVASAVLTALKPRGCIAEECAFRSMRQGGVLDGVLFIAAVLLLAVGCVGLVSRARRRGGFGRLGRLGLYAVVAGAALGFIGVSLNVWAPGLVPFFVIPALFTVVVGFLLLGVAVVQSKALPPWAGVLLAVGALSMLGANDQDWRVLMVVPFGLAWIAVGYAMRVSGGAEAVDPRA